MHTQRAEQMRQAEELLGNRRERSGFVKGLFFGEYLQERLPPYPALRETNEREQALRKLCCEVIDPVAIDREACIPERVIRGLGELGVLGACLPAACGGLGVGQLEYCRLLEILGAHCASTALFVNAHHSIGPRALVLFGTPEQQARYLPRLASGEWISAFALTEAEAGSDAANVQTQAVPTADGRGYILNGEKRWITNGGIARVLTVMARTPASHAAGTNISAFLVTADMPGFEVVEQRMEKMGVRGTATSRLAFRDCFVPRENVLGPLGKGLKIALTVLDFGRTTFGACCTGAAKDCVARSVRHAQTRVQFGQKLSSFELVQQKLAHMQAGAYAMEACTYQTAALIDSQADDYMLETAMLKVFATETLWTILHDTFQLHGGQAYFCDQPFERMVRDHRIDLIGEGANDVLRAFTAAVGLRDVGIELEALVQAIRNPWTGWGRLGTFAGRRLGNWLTCAEVPVRQVELEAEAVHLGQGVRELGVVVERLLVEHQLDVIDRQLHLARVADAATLLYVSACVVRRLDAMLSEPALGERDRQLELATGRYFLATARRRVKGLLAEVSSNDDGLLSELVHRLVRQEHR
jgi:alkylation response protein AidB-like acyl-CoA dehydrogenase